MSNARQSAERGGALDQQAAAAAGTTVVGRSLLDGITLDYGPIDLLGRFFLAADTALRARDITVSFASLDELVAVNRQQSDTWRPLLPIFNPQFNTLDDSNSFALFGRDRYGTVVATQAARLFNWSETNFAVEAANLRLFYADAARNKLERERIDITAASAAQVTGRVAFSGGVWFHPDHRGKLLTAILPRISRALAFTRWYTDITTTIMAARIVESGVASRCGYTRIDWDLTLQETRVGTVRCALLTMYTAEMLTDLRAFLENFDAKVDRRVDDRAVQQPNPTKAAAGR